MAQTNKHATKPVAPVAHATTETPAPVAPAEPTNDKIEQLKADRKAAKIAAREFEPDSKEANDLDMKAWKIDEQIKIEIANVRKQQADNEKAEKRNARIALFDSAVDHLLSQFSDEQKTAAKSNEAYIAARETVVNQLLGSIPASAKTTSGDKPAGNGTKGATTAAVRAYARPFLETATRETVAEIGKQIRKELIAQGFNDGTMNAAVRALEVEMGLKD